MAVVISCPHCKIRIQASSEHSGRQVACPRCKGAFTIPVIESQRAAVLAVAPTDDPLDFLNGTETQPTRTKSLRSKSVKPVSSTRGASRKPKSFIDTITATVENLVGSKSAKPGFAAGKIGEWLKGLPIAKKVFLGWGTLISLFVLCGGLLSVGSTQSSVGISGASTASPQSPRSVRLLQMTLPECKKLFDDLDLVWTSGGESKEGVEEIKGTRIDSSSMISISLMSIKGVVAQAQLGQGGLQGEALEKYVDAATSAEIKLTGWVDCPAWVLKGLQDMGAELNRSGPKSVKREIVHEGIRITLAAENGLVFIQLASDAMLKYGGK